MRSLALVGGVSSAQAHYQQPQSWEIGNDGREVAFDNVTNKFVDKSPSHVFLVEKVLGKDDVQNSNDYNTKERLVVGSSDIRETRVLTAWQRL